MKKMMMVIVMLLAASTAYGLTVENDPETGVVKQVDDWFQKNLKDPDSLQYITWYKVKREGDAFLVRVRYRAKNGFGGYNIEESLCIFTPSGHADGCVEFNRAVGLAQDTGPYTIKEIPKKWRKVVPIVYRVPRMPPEQAMLTAQNRRHFDDSLVRVYSDGLFVFTQRYSGGRWSTIFGEWEEIK